MTFAVDYAAAASRLIERFGESVVLDPGGSPSGLTGIVKIVSVETGYDEDGEYQLRRTILRVADSAVGEPQKGDGEAVKPDEWGFLGRVWRVVDYEHQPAVWVITLEAMDKERWSRPDLRRGT